MHWDLLLFGGLILGGGVHSFYTAEIMLKVGPPISAVNEPIMYWMTLSVTLIFGLYLVYKGFKGDD